MCVSGTCCCAADTGQTRRPVRGPQAGPPPRSGEAEERGKQGPALDFSLEATGPWEGTGGGTVSQDPGGARQKVAGVPQARPWWLGQG